MEIWMQNDGARVEVQTTHNGYLWTVDFALGWSLAMAKWIPFINDKGQQAGWTIEAWLPKRNPLPRDTGATNVRQRWRSRADTLHIVSRREFNALRNTL